MKDVPGTQPDPYHHQHLVLESNADRVKAASIGNITEDFIKCMVLAAKGQSRSHVQSPYSSLLLETRALPQHRGHFLGV